VALFRRKPKDTRRDPAVLAAQRAAVAAFWAWWTAEGAGRTAAAIAEHEPTRMVPHLSDRVHAIHRDLGWELAAGSLSEHVLVVTPEGDPALRAVARRWLLAAPPSDLVWEYSDVRPPTKDLEGTTLTIASKRLDLASALVGARVAGTAIDVVVHHPEYPDMTREDRDRATFLLLDAALGESAVETWIGGVTSSTIPSLDPVPLLGLRSVVAEIAARFTDADGQASWSLLSGTAADGSAIVAGTQVPLRPVTAPHLDTHVAVAVPYTGRNPAGLPDDASLQALHDLENHLAERLGTSGRLVAHQASSGVRVMHLYVDGSTPAAEQVRAAVAGWTEGTVTVEVREDPGWKGVAHLAG
jgi:hypothetical protein